VTSHGSQQKKNNNNEREEEKKFRKKKLKTPIQETELKIFIRCEALLSFNGGFFYSTTFLFSIKLDLTETILVR